MVPAATALPWNHPQSRLNNFSHLFRCPIRKVQRLPVFDEATINRAFAGMVLHLSQQPGWSLWNSLQIALKAIEAFGPLPITGARIGPIQQPLAPPEHLIAGPGIRQPKPAYLAPQGLWDAVQVLRRIGLGTGDLRGPLQAAAPLLCQLGQVAIHVEDHQPFAAWPGKHTNSPKNIRPAVNLERDISRRHHGVVRLLQRRLALAHLPGLKAGTLDVDRRVGKALRQLRNKIEQVLRLSRHSVRLLQERTNDTLGPAALGCFSMVDERSTPCYCVTVASTATPKHPLTEMGFLSKKASTTINAGSSGGGYLSVSKLPDGGSVRFALLVAQPLEGYEAWGANAEGQSKPFRFDFEPTREDVIQELGEYEPREGRGGPGTVDVKFFIAAPVYNFDSGSVQVMSLTQKSIIKELDQISQMDDYDDLLAWDFNLSKKGSGLLTEYTLRPVPRKKGSQEHIDAAWIEARAAGFDISRLLTGGNPFKAA
jgi:hypothetical protein